jgi:hypothetical protein
MKQDEVEQNHKKTHAGRGAEIKWEIPGEMPAEIVSQVRQAAIRILSTATPMGFTRKVSLAYLLLLAATLPLAAFAAPPGTYTCHMMVDQFGYPPDLPKVAVISDPITGFNATNYYTPGPTLQVRTWNSNIVVFSAAPTPWNNGQTNTQSGDRAWWFDFSSVTTWGQYYIYDPSNDTRSAHFTIDHHVYENIMQVAMHMYYYQRRGTAKVTPYADPRWTDGTNFMGPLQDTQCEQITNAVPATQRDLHGGWFDAGDYNKYTAWVDSDLSDLLFAYIQNPGIWPDNWNLPESGNGIPDLLNEAKWELDWLLRMQNPDGSVLSKVGVNGFQNASPPSTETSQTFYGCESTTATLAAAASFAEGARGWLIAGQPAYADTLSNAAVAAYNWGVVNSNVIYDNADFQSGSPEVDTDNYAYNRDAFRLRAAIFLYDLTHQAGYQNFVEATYPDRLAITSGWWGPFEFSAQDAMLYYATLPGVSAASVHTIHASIQGSVNGSDWLPQWTGNADPYQAYVPDYDYLWGGNMVKCHMGLLFADQLTYGLNPAQASNYRAAAAGFIHYIHGVNPLAMTYLVNMYGSGAENCANEMYHSWFGYGTIYNDALSSPNGPAAGYLTGGPNASFAPDPSYSGPTLAPPMNQPPQKAYKDWNYGWPQDSWEITEPDIGYQAAYVFLLSKFIRPLTYQDWLTGYGLTGSATNLTANPAGDGEANIIKYAFNLSPLVINNFSLPAFQLRPQIIGAQTNTFFTVQFPRQMGATNLTYVLQGSSDLTNWTDLCTVAGTNVPAGPGFISQIGTGTLRQVQARDIQAVESATTPRFFRFKLVVN